MTARIAYDLVQGLLLVLVLGASCVYLLNRVAPTAMAALQLRVSRWLSGPQHRPWLRRLASRLAPEATAPGNSGACGQCGGCAKRPAGAQRSADKFPGS